MSEEAFRAQVLAHPGEPGPRLVWADSLDERGDMRCEWLRYWVRLEAALRCVPLARESRHPRLRRTPDEPPPGPSDRLTVAVVTWMTPVFEEVRLGDFLAATHFPDETVRLKQVENTYLGSCLVGCGLAALGEPQGALTVVRAAAEHSADSSFRSAFNAVLALNAECGFTLALEHARTCAFSASPLGSAAGWQHRALWKAVSLSPPKEILCPTE